MYQLQNGTMLDYKLYVVSDNAEIKSVKITKGPSMGSQVFLLYFRAYNQNITKKIDGSYEKGETIFYDVEFFDKKEVLDNIQNFIKKGMLLRVTGVPKTKEYTKKDGTKARSHIFQIYSIAIDLKQKGLKKIEFEKVNNSNNTNNIEV